MDLQQIQDDYQTRIKFAITSDSDISKDVSGNNHNGILWDSTPDDWIEVDEGNVLPEPWTHPHTAKLFGTPAGDLMAVEHETGLEIIVAGAAVVSAASSVIALFQTWRSHRRADHEPEALMVERRVEEPDGRVTLTTVHVPASLVTEEILCDLAT